ncbi:MAG: hypothetical protein BRD40_04235 [Bacteroidetes bacterium QS_1_65_9]|nr:MAG: hypothetical protein BRD40_04235 [Bacteroidetes bacterium QS_1_65_9]
MHRIVRVKGKQHVAFIVKRGAAPSILWFSMLLSAMLLLPAGAGCISSGAQRSSGGDPDVITRKQIQEAEATSTAYALVQRLRPHWLRKRGSQSISNPGSILVYVDGSRSGAPSSLRNVQAINVKSIEFLGASEATTQYGTGHEHGVIEVDTKDGKQN